MEGETEASPQKMESDSSLSSLSDNDDMDVGVRVDLWSECELSDKMTGHSEYLRVCETFSPILRPCMTFIENINRQVLQLVRNAR